MTDEQTTSTDVITALARFRAADAQMHQRVRATSSLGENELRILQFLLHRQHEGAVVRPSELSRHLGISSASTTALIDRLERQGSVRRVSHPTDRRSLLIAPTTEAERSVADLVDAFENRVAAIVDGLDESGRSCILGFLADVTAAADRIATGDDWHSRSDYARA